MTLPTLWKLVPALLVAGVVGMANAKLPPPTEGQKSKSEEAKAKTAEGAKSQAQALARAQDRVVQRYKKEQSVKTVGSPAAAKK